MTSCFVAHHDWPNPRKSDLGILLVAEEGPELDDDVVAVGHAQELRVVVQPMLSRLASQSVQNQGNLLQHF